MALSSQALRRVAKELKDLSTKPLEGILVIPNERDVTEITSIIDGPAETPFEGGSFKIKLKLGSDFPAAPPKGFFITKIFHPNVAPSTGEICVNTLKRDWNDSYGISHILLTIKCLLMVPNAESSLNEEAGRLLLERYDDYFARAKTWTTIHAVPVREEKDKEKEDKEENEKADRKDSDEPVEENALGEINANADNKAKAPMKPVIVTASSKPKAAAAPKRGVKRL